MTGTTENSPALRGEDWSRAETLKRYLALGAEWRLLGYDADAVHAFAAFGLPDLRQVRSIAVLRAGPDSAAIVCTHESESPPAGVDTLDFAGARWRDWIVLFHAETRSAQGAVSFRVEPDGELNFLVTGLAPGPWEVWRNGWIEETGWRVEPRKGLLEWRGRAGSYFMRRLG